MAVKRTKQRIHEEVLIAGWLDMALALSWSGRSGKL